MQTCLNGFNPVHRQTDMLPKTPADHEHDHHHCKNAGSNEKNKKKHKLKEQEQGRILTVFTILGKFTKLHILVSAMS